jgi:hypothetical protein
VRGSASKPSSDNPERVRRRTPAASVNGSTVRTHRSDGEVSTRLTP